MSYAIYVGKNHSATGHAWLAGYGDEPSSHWLQIHPRQSHPPSTMITVGVGPEADLPGLPTRIPQVPETARNIRVNYSYYKGVPAPITNGGLNEYGVAVRDIWSPSRPALIEMTPPDQTGPTYSDLARIVLERARTARGGVELIGQIIAEHGETTYGGNSHLIADADEAWVVIQFAGAQRLWAAERLGPDSIRASRPGYIGALPIDQPDHPDFLYAPHLVDFAKAQGWYHEGPFDVNAVLGDGKGRWAGVQWIEGEMAARAARPGRIGLADMIWAIRTPRLTGDTAGYGQVVPLDAPPHAAARVMWHMAIGALAAPAAPVFMGQTEVPDEFGPHRYLTTGESHRFMDNRKAVTGAFDTLSTVPQAAETSRSAVAECKRLMYLMLRNQEQFIPEVTACFDAHEARCAQQADAVLRAANALLDRADTAAAETLLNYFSRTELLAGLDLVQTLTASLALRARLPGSPDHGPGPVMFDQIW